MFYTKRSRDASGWGMVQLSAHTTFSQGLTQRKVFAQAQQTVNQKTAPNKTETLLARALLVIDRGRVMKHSALLTLISALFLDYL